jgi:hypothetical protein
MSEERDNEPASQLRDIKPASVQSALPDDIRESIALGSFLGITGQPSTLSNLAYSNTIINTNLTQQNTVNNQQAMNQVAKSVLGTTVNLVADVSPMEAVAVTKLDTGNDVAQQLIDLKGVLAGFPNENVTPTPAPQPLNPKPNPDGGGVILTATIDDFPITLAFGNKVSSSKSPNRPGTQFTVNNNSFPVKILLKGKPTKPPATIADVSRSRFPFTVNIEGGSGPPIKEEPPQGPGTLTVAEAKFPVKINLTP